ncbi:hypothetical protein M011DRAFT_114874 [Sporormia fimetaria CBS 119925]|uniref:Uncharacterized protein n=1 Tax=Sporormia fimetaria CBS 119925 TaxID=1340428 RepID=A0A6A6VLK6_9PLEO|nr:hypothetical protein M011DRAFT_114874 [Sporormia fimetaria CBS 119925]
MWCGGCGVGAGFCGRRTVCVRGFVLMVVYGLWSLFSLHSKVHAVRTLTSVIERAELLPPTHVQPLLSSRGGTSRAHVLPSLLLSHIFSPAVPHCGPLNTM